MLILNYTMKLIVHSLHNINLNMDILSYIDAGKRKQYYSALTIEQMSVKLRWVHWYTGFHACYGAARKKNAFDVLDFSYETIQDKPEAQQCKANVENIFYLI